MEESQSYGREGNSTFLLGTALASFVSSFTAIDTRFLLAAKSSSRTYWMEMEEACKWEYSLSLSLSLPPSFPPSFPPLPYTFLLCAHWVGSSLFLLWTVTDALCSKSTLTMEARGGQQEEQGADAMVKVLLFRNKKILDCVVYLGGYNRAYHALEGVLIKPQVLNFHHASVSLPTCTPLHSAMYGNVQPAELLLFTVNEIPV